MIFAGERVNADKHIPRAFETEYGPLGPEGCSLTENTSFVRFSAGLRLPNYLKAVGEILIFSGLAAIFAGLEFAGLLNQAKGQATPHANLAALRLSVAAEWDQLAAVKIRRAAAVKPSLRKMK